MLTRLAFATPIGALVALTAMFVAAQEGYPLDGTWRGQWGAADGLSGQVVIVMKWDGDDIYGLINPGPNSYEFTSATLEPGDWSVRFEAETPAGESVIAAGTLKEIGSYNRVIEGTWTLDGTAHALKLTRE